MQADRGIAANLVMKDIDDDEPEDLTDWEDPDESDQDADDEPEVMPCPYCGKSVHEQTEWCHHCGKYLSEEDRATSPPGWIVIGTLLGLLGVIGFCLLAFLGWLMR